MLISWFVVYALLEFYPQYASLRLAQQHISIANPQCPCLYHMLSILFITNGLVSLLNRTRALWRVVGGRALRRDLGSAGFLAVDNVEWHVRVGISVKVGFADASQEDIDLFLAPAQTLDQRHQRDGFEALHQHGAPVHADLAQRPVARPRSDRREEDALRDVDEAGRAHLGGQLRRQAEIDAARPQAIANVVPVGDHGVVGNQRAVFGAREVVQLLALDPAAGSEVVVGAREECGPVAEGLDRVPRVDVVERFGLMQPIGLGVVHHEFQVWRNPLRLDWAEVDAED